MIKEKFKRIPIVAFFYRIFHPGYGTCGICGLPWSNCKAHTIKMDSYSGFFSICEHCWQHSSISQIKQVCAKLHASWESQGQPSYTLESMLKAVDGAKHAEWDLELEKAFYKVFQEKKANHEQDSIH